MNKKKQTSKIDINTIFSNWYAQNESRFAVRLIKTRRRIVRSYTFEGITNDISFSLDDGGIVIWAYNNGEPVDMLDDFDAVLGYKPKSGYYCKLCIKPIYYKTAEEFYIQECFEPLLNWVNSKLAVSKYLYLCYLDGRDGITWAYLNKKDRRGILKLVRSKMKKNNKDIEKIRINIRKAK